MGNSEYFPSVYEKTSCSGGKKMEMVHSNGIFGNK